MVFRWFLDGFYMDFGWILDGFWMDKFLFSLLIQSTYILVRVTLAILSFWRIGGMGL